MTGHLTREEAAKLAQAILQAHQIVGSPGLNAHDFGGFDRGDQPVVFEYVSDSQVLNVLALCYRFRKPPRPGLLDACREEAATGTNTGGGALEFRADSGGLFLTRTYRQMADAASVLGEIDNLMQGAKFWAEDVLPAVANKVFGHDP